MNNVNSVIKGFPKKSAGSQTCKNSKLTDFGFKDKYWTQNWTAYNSAQTQEKVLFMKLLIVNFKTIY